VSPSGHGIPASAELTLVGIKIYTPGGATPPMTNRANRIQNNKND